MKDKNVFDQDYYENGIKKKVSGYENYSWMPTRSIPEAITICDNIKFSSAVDFGCAKGFLVHALSLVSNSDVTGVDISEYAIDNCLPQIKEKLRVLEGNLSSMGIKADLIIAKDVLEHIPEEEIDGILSDFYACCNQALLIIPLGDNDKFRIREYEMDITHVTKKDEEWWIEKIRKSGFSVKRFSYELGSIKEKWVKEFPYGNGFFHIEKK
jgi:hypothetical protein